MDNGEGPLFVRPDPDGFRKWMQERKAPLGSDKRMDEREAVRKLVSRGDYVATDMYGMVRGPVSIVREIIRQRIGDLGLAGQGGMDIDLLVGSGLVKRIDCIYIGHEVFGLSNAFRRKAQGGHVVISEWTNAALAWRFKAAAMGVSFVPTRTMLGTDTFKRSGAKSAPCPFTGETQCYLPALAPDVGIVHVHRCDKFGNAVIDGTSGMAGELARASKKLIISTEHIVPESAIRKQPERTLIPHYLVDAVVEAKYGAHPGEMCYEYAMDRPRVQEYLSEMETEEGEKRFFDKFIFGTKSHEDYLDLVGGPKQMRKLEKACRGR